MKKILLAICILSGFLFAADMYNPKAEKKNLTIEIELLGKDGNTKVGEIVAVETKYGVAFYPNLSGLEPGLHGFHIHQNADCGPTDKGLGMKAGGHWDPDNTGKHSYPWDDKGHKGDLPALYVDKDGKATNPVLAPKIKSLDEIKNKSLMIHIGGDNHHDHPAALGGGGARMACGVIK
ncbi:superoxide dismutase [Helicobacter sp. 16-1353]|uniref:superoxide dismutase family protein n=1 Tax=Helicobacter sp. 16-1353 TaxID=2004996 RepID=UPI000DCDFA36|nr:superoxide dismutase family protein [Helicobacter sp. 16-1353]RAX54408.1 superoxide dismutase [Helicobacter sp. 16-1353]